jgi:hypothetical protein
MSNILPFKRSEPKNKRNTLCNEGHHKWKIVQEKQFDTRLGKLVTLYQCERCDKQRTQLL